jgi:short-subunit dehydrogenase
MEPERSAGDRVSVRGWDRALVTGASSGIGEAFARQLGAAGTALVLVARNKERLDELAAEIRFVAGATVEVLPADLADDAARSMVERRVAADAQPVDLLINNAGFGFNGEFGEIGVSDVQAEVDVNITALMRLTHAAVRRMTAAGRGTIINMSSVAAFQPSVESANYSATKAYVLSFSQSVHEEVASKGVNVCCVCPGLTRTEFQERGGYDVSSPGFTWQTADEVARAGLDAARKGRVVEVTGWHNKVLTTGTRKLPMDVVRWSSTQVTKRFRG